MKKENFKKLALLGITGGLILSSASAQAIYSQPRNGSNYNQSIANRNGCSGSDWSHETNGQNSDSQEGSYRPGTWPSQGQQSQWQPQRQPQGMQQQGQRPANQRNWQNDQTNPSSQRDDRWMRGQTADNTQDSTMQNQPGMNQQNPNMMQNRQSTMPPQNNDMMQNRAQGMQQQHMMEQNRAQGMQQQNMMQQNRAQGMQQHNMMQNRAQGMQDSSPNKVVTPPQQASNEQAISETSFYSQLDQEGKRVWNTLDSDARQLAIRLSKQFSNKNQAVREAQRHMNERKSQPSGMRGNFESRPSGMQQKGTSPQQSEGRQYMFD